MAISVQQRASAAYSAARWSPGADAASRLSCVGDAGRSRQIALADDHVRLGHGANPDSRSHADRGLADGHAPVHALGPPSPSCQPEVVQGLDRIEGERRSVGVSGAPFERRVDVLELLFEHVERRCLLVTAEALRSLDRPRQHPIAVTVAAPIHLTFGRQSVPTVLAHRLEQAVAALGTGSLGDDQRAPDEVDQRREHIADDDASSVTTASIASNDIEAGNTARRWKIVRSTGSRHARSNRAGSACCDADPGRSVPGSPAPRVGHAGVDLGRAEHVCLGGRELDGQREAVEPPAQRGHGGCVAFVDAERRLDGRRPIGEEAHGVDCGDARRIELVRRAVSSAVEVGRPPHRPRRAARARDQQAERPSRGEQAMSQRGGVGDHVLAVVEDDDPAERGAALRDGDVEARSGDLRARRSPPRPSTPTIDRRWPTSGPRTRRRRRSAPAPRRPPRSRGGSCRRRQDR